MNERLPYEEQLSQQWNDLPLPDENMAWADMKRRLEEDDERRPLPFWLRGCAGWGLLGILLLGLGWWILRPERWFTDKKEKTTASIPQKAKTGVTDPATVSLDTSVKIKEQKDSASKITGETNISKVTIADTLARKPVTTISIDQKKPQPVTTTPTPVAKTATGKKTTTKTIVKKIKGEKTVKDKQVKPDGAGVEPGKPAIEKKEETVVKEEKQTEPPITTNPQVPVKDSLIIINTEPKKDTAHKTLTDSAAKETKEPEQVKKPKKDSTKSKSFSVSAGMAMHQQLPIAGQSFTPYNALGRKGSLRDYIPSVYVRLNRDDKWFIQSGFRYGAPQLVKKFLYASKTDTISIQKYNTTSTTLEKTFYHQVPLSFNYFILPNWSLGAGVVWNKFSSAVSSRDIIQTDRFTGLDSTISTGTILTSRQADTNFVKSYFQALIETQYKWKRFSFGASYAFGLEPYIRFNVGGQMREEKNSALQLFIRYELLRSKKK